MYDLRRYAAKFSIIDFHFAFRLYKIHSEEFRPDRF